MEDNLMMEMRAKYYPYHEQTKNLIEALEYIKEDMQIGCHYTEFWDTWTDLPDDWVIEWDTIEKLKEQGFTVFKRWWNKGELGEHYTIIVAWDDFEKYINDEEI